MTFDEARDRGTFAVFRPRQRSLGNAEDVLSRALDISVSLLALIFFAPLLLAVALAIYVTDPGPIFFAHRRIGRRGRTFACLKFRSMVVNADQRIKELLDSDPVARREWERDHKLRNDPRITPLGNFLRRSSLDELPQLFNVLRGEMSIVGPRPIVFDEVPRYGRYYQHYCLARPGITGLWQINGRNDVSYRRRVALDTTYARTRTVFFDIEIMLRTVPAVLASRGSY